MTLRPCRIRVVGNDSLSLQYFGDMEIRTQMESADRLR